MNYNPKLVNYSTKSIANKILACSEGENCDLNSTNYRKVIQYKASST